MKGGIAISCAYDRRTQDLGVSIHHPAAEYPMALEPCRALWIAEVITAFALAINPNAKAEAPPGSRPIDPDELKRDIANYRETLTPNVVADITRLSKEVDDSMTPIEGDDTFKMN